MMKFALEAVVRGDADPAQKACAGGMDFRSELDDVLTEESQRVMSYPPGEMGPPGPLEILEIKHQWQSLELIKSVPEPNAELISSLRQLARDANKDLEIAISEIRKGRR